MGKGVAPLALSVAIPSSSLSDESLKADKTRKVSVLARACAIFGVTAIYVYQESKSKEEGAFIAMLLRYLETPQFLRKRLFPRVNDLKFAGVLHPLRIPSHATPADAKKVSGGDAREGIIVGHRGKTYVDIGINRLVPYRGKARPGRRVTVQFKEGYPALTIKEIPRSEAPKYWGYAVKERASLHSLLKEWEGDIIITSRKGRPASCGQLERYAGRDVLLVFGSPEKGVHEILGAEARRVQNAKVFDFFPGQSTETVRLEEALLGALSIMNACGACRDG